MKQSIPNWLTTIMVAAIIAGAPFQMGAAESEPAKANTQPADKSAPARPGAVTPGTKRDTYPFRGKVASFDTNALALKLEGKAAQRVVLITSQTRLTKQGQPAVADDLKAGEEVGGTLRKSPEGREEALLIRIGPKPDTDTQTTRSRGKPARNEAAE